MHDPDIVVIGGGLAGVPVFYELARRGARVLLVEAREEIALETSFANGGMITPSMADPWNRPGIGLEIARSLAGLSSPVKLRPGAAFRHAPSLLPWVWQFWRSSRRDMWLASAAANLTLASYSAARIAALQAEHAIACDYQARGTLKIYDDKRALAEAVQTLREIGTAEAGFSALGRDETLSLEPSLAGMQLPLAGAIHFPGDAAGDARAFTIGLAKAGEAAGGVIRTGTKVAGLRLAAGRLVALTLEKAGQAEEIPVQQAVLAAGVLSPKLGRMAGLRLPVQPVKGYSLTFAFPDGADLPSRPVIEDRRHAAATPLGSRLRLNGTVEISGPDRLLREDRLALLRELGRDLFPTLMDQAEANPAAWCGLRPMSGDGRPLIGHTSVPGLFVNTGHGHLGWTFSAGAGGMLAAMMCGEVQPVAAGPFDPQRF